MRVTWILSKLLKNSHVWLYAIFFILLYIMFLFWPSKIKEKTLVYVHYICMAVDLQFTQPLLFMSFYIYSQLTDWLNVSVETLLLAVLLVWPASWHKHLHSCAQKFEQKGNYCMLLVQCMGCIWPASACKMVFKAPRAMERRMSFRHVQRLFQHQHWGGGRRGSTVAFLEKEIGGVTQYSVLRCWERVKYIDT